MRKRVVLLCALFCLLTLVLTNAVSAHLLGSVEWLVDPITGRPHRHLHIYCRSTVTKEWKEYLKDAVSNWNNEKTGWTLEIVNSADDADVLFNLASIPPKANGDVPGGKCRFEYDGTTGELLLATITMNTDMSMSWGRTGAWALDPIRCAMHELGHAMRLAHSPAGNVMKATVACGDHDSTINRDDAQEAKDAAETPEAEPDVQKAQGEAHVTAGDAALSMRETDFSAVPTAYGVGLNLLPMPDALLPDPLAVPADQERVLAAAGIFPVTAAFAGPAALTLTVTPCLINGWAMTGDLHHDLLPPVDMSQMIAVRWVEAVGGGSGASLGDGHWEAAGIPASFDEQAGQATLTVTGGGIYGIAAPMLARAPVRPLPAFTDLGPTQRPLVRDALTELKAMDIYRGYPDGGAGPARNLTRLEFFTLAVRIAGGEAAAAALAGKRPAFTDAIPAWGWGYVNEAVALGLTTGYPDGTFRSQQDVTGNECLAVLVRLLGPAENALAKKTPWPQGYTDVAGGLGILDDFACLTTDCPLAKLGGAMTRADMAVLTRSAMWTEKRHDAAGAIITGQSLASRGGWWRAPVTVQAKTSDGRRWLLDRPAPLPGGPNDVMRLDVPETLYLAPGTALPAVGAGSTVTVLARGDQVKAILSAGGGA
jgi:hypothetical protein